MGNCYVLVCFIYGCDFNSMLEIRKDPGDLVSGPGLSSGHKALGKLLYCSVDQFHPG